ncbi:hypothetical protein [Parasulfitobacter algicola]|uniref:Uncharacterized protein n=1 Tax=Parasulfitobacter algicola TaxID=2614809 RepID=A0ABX2IT98_9RHOB|nr:hypothetical protein [Sulfitobacter algicola]NSX54037.1 hypothetical protein [Sulfitobacter algicola]
MKKLVLMIALTFGSVAPVLAQQFTPPNGCKGHLTVQYRGCLMNNIWTCEADNPGDKWMALFTDRGPSRVRKVDDEFQWLETYYINPVATELMQNPAPDPASLAELFATNYDTYDFVKSIKGNATRQPLRYVGYDRLTGEETVIDGERLLNTEYSYSASWPNGEVAQTRTGRQYVHPEERIFLFGTSANADGTERTDHTPVEFIRPGEPGFFSSKPRYDCDVLMSNYMPEGSEE